MATNRERAKKHHDAMKAKGYRNLKVFIPGDRLELLDEASAHHGLSRSDFLEHAIEHYSDYLEKRASV